MWLQVNSIPNIIHVAVPFGPFLPAGWEEDESLLGWKFATDWENSLQPASELLQYTLQPTRELVNYYNTHKGVKLPVLRGWYRASVFQNKTASC